VQVTADQERGLIAAVLAALGTTADEQRDVADALVEAARRHVALRDVRDAASAGVGALARQPGGEPVGASGLIAIDVREAEADEPRRGPCAQVSLVVVAVDDDRPAAIEALGSLAAQGFQRQVDRAREVLGLELLRRHDVDELRPLRDELLGVVAVDHGEHVLPLLVLQRAIAAPLKEPESFWLRR